MSGKTKVSLLSSPKSTYHNKETGLASPITLFLALRSTLSSIKNSPHGAVGNTLPIWRISNLGATRLTNRMKNYQYLMSTITRLTQMSHHKSHSRSSLRMKKTNLQYQVQFSRIPSRKKKCQTPTPMPLAFLTELLLTQNLLLQKRPVLS